MQNRRLSPLFDTECVLRIQGRAAGHVLLIQPAVGQEFTVDGRPTLAVKVDITDDQAMLMAGALDIRIEHVAGIKDKQAE